MIQVYFHSSTSSYSIWQAQLVEDVFYSVHIFGFFIKIQIPVDVLNYVWHLFLFHWSMCLFSCQFYAEDWTGPRFSLRLHVWKRNAFPLLKLGTTCNGLGPEPCECNGFGYWKPIFPPCWVRLLIPGPLCAHLWSSWDTLCSLGNISWFSSFWLHPTVW